jgi:hypothetical protein
MEEFYLLVYNTRSPFKVNRIFGGKCPLDLHGGITSQVRNQRESRWQQCFFFCLVGYSYTLKMEQTCSSESRLSCNRLHGVISQEIEHFTNTSVTTSNPTVSDSI